MKQRHMNTRRLALILILALLAMAALTGCGGDKESGEGTGTGDGAFDHSAGLDDNGYWEGVTALDYVELAAYEGIEVPADVHTITEDAVQTEIDAMLSYFTTTNQVKDRAVKDGDTVNIDYVGSVDGVEFDGGSTGGAGTEVTIGVTSYIDDFLEQLIGHKPGESFDVNVTFPVDYGNEELNGKDAVFAVSINYIAEKVEPELTDAFVAENLQEQYGVTTVAALTDYIRNNLKESAITNFVQKFLVDNSTVSELPASILTYLEGSMTEFYRDYAENAGMELDEFLAAYGGVESIDAMLEQSKDSNVQTGEFHLLVQAVAEDAGIIVEKADVDRYFSEYIKMDDYSQYEEQYGMPYLKLSVLQQMVLEMMVDNAKLL